MSILTVVLGSNSAEWIANTSNNVLISDGAGNSKLTVNCNNAWGLGDTVNFGAAGCVLKDRKSTRLNSSHIPLSRMPSSA